VDPAESVSRTGLTWHGQVTTQALAQRVVTNGPCHTAPGETLSIIILSKEVVRCWGGKAGLTALTGLPDAQPSCR